jgi:hypothetical protein
MSVLTTGAFWSAAIERAVKTAAQSVLVVLGVGATTPADIDWKEALLGAGIGALMSLLTSIASSGVGNVGPSLTSEVLSPPAPEIPADQ